jgi:NAD(P)H-hydrate repair Nnr-like enzyme with NAD(P)H-hydrate epimerase domain
MRIANSEDIRRIDQEAASRPGGSLDVLMERAAIAALAVSEELFGSLSRRTSSYFAARATTVVMVWRWRVS